MTHPREVDVVFLIADLAGYTALTEAMGDMEAAKVIARYVELVDGVLRPGTRMLERVGDEVLIVGDDVASTLRTAMDLHAAVECEPLFPAVRGGLHAGRVLEHDGKYFGAALNLAARVASHAVAGQILCTETVARQAKGLEDIQCREVGPVHFRNIVDPVRIFEVISGPGCDQTTVVDPVCRMPVTPETATPYFSFGGTTYYFCSLGCARAFAERRTSTWERPAADDPRRTAHGARLNQVSDGQGLGRRTDQKSKDRDLEPSRRGDRRRGEPSRRGEVPRHGDTGDRDQREARIYGRPARGCPARAAADRSVSLEGTIGATGAAVRGFRNPFRSRTRPAVVVVLLALVTGFLGLMVQAALASRQLITRLDARVRTLVELREAGAFGTGGFGGDKPVGEHDFSVDTLERVRQIPHATRLARVDEYVYTPQIDPSRSNAYAMVIGLRPGAAMRAIGEVDYENARIVAGRALAQMADRVIHIKDGKLEDLATAR